MMHVSPLSERAYVTRPPKLLSCPILIARNLRRSMVRVRWLGPTVVHQSGLGGKDCNTRPNLNLDRGEMNSEIVLRSYSLGVNELLRSMIRRSICRSVPENLLLLRCN
jgi:hypothetical protein